jgi:polysaccharide export outer membrane protein
MTRLTTYPPIVCIFLLSALLISACSSTKNITYFKDVPDSIYLVAKNVPSPVFQDPIIQSNDLLQISFLTLDPQANTVLTNTNSGSFTVQPGTSSSPTTPGSISGFMVDRNGEIEIPVVGKIKVSGMTTAVARDSIHSKVSLYYKNPVVNVRFANFNITVLGEVARPATYVVPNEKVSVLDAIGMAGDLTIYGKRTNVMLVRDSVGQKQFIRFNLNSAETFNSPYFYLKQGDVVYVEPSKSKIATTDGVRTRNFALIASGVSLLMVIISRI